MQVFEVKQISWKFLLPCVKATKDTDKWQSKHDWWIDLFGLLL